MVRLIAGPCPLAVAAIVKLPIALQLGTGWTSVKVCGDYTPRQSTMLVQVVGGDGVGDALKTERVYHPVEQYRGVVGFDGTEHAFVDQIIARIIDKGCGACKATHGIDNFVG